MADSEQRTIGGLRVQIDRLVCVGFEDCVVRAPQIFQLDGDGIACFRPEPAAIEPARVIDACRACPVDALTVIDESGTQQAP